ncbi:MAG: LLM class F420-dependent oxidoreductase [Alphaproteobacteria bacterium]|jgi:probable F420-dependent oxidoreductase
MTTKSQLGFALPIADTGGNPIDVKTMAQTAEGLGFSYLAAPDHVLGVNADNRPDWGNWNTSQDTYVDAFVLFGFLAGVCPTIRFSTEVMILAQRQAVLVAKQAASLAALCEGRFRFGVGIGWNPVEFTGLGMEFSNRGARSEEQVQVMQALWANEHVTFNGKWHQIDDAGINPMPPGGKVPLWFGGHAPATIRRIARYGDGWMYLNHPPGNDALADLASLRAAWQAQGRPGEPEICVRLSAGAGTPEDWRKTIDFWQQAGITHFTLHNAFSRSGFTRIEGRSVSAHLETMIRYHAAVADMFD